MRIFHVAFLSCAITACIARPAGKDNTGWFKNMPEGYQFDVGSVGDWFKGKMDQARDMFCPGCMGICRNPKMKFDRTDPFKRIVDMNPWVRTFL